MIIGQYWKNEIIGNVKQQASKTCGVEFIDLSDIQNKSEWQEGMGTIVYDAQGGEHVIEHEGVAAHLGDKGMEKIAEKIINKLTL